MVLQLTGLSTLRSIASRGFRPFVSAAALGAVVILGLLTASCSADSTVGAQPTVQTADQLGEARQVLGPGDVAPSFSAPLLSGGQLSLEALRGQPVIVNFWLTTCEPCLREMPALAAAAAANAGEGLVVIGVNQGEHRDLIVEFLASFETEIDFPIVLDPGQDIGAAYEIVAFPTSYFVDGFGVIQYRRFGELREEHLEVGLSRIVPGGAPPGQ